MSTNLPPVLSVVIPVFNEETWIVRSVSAVQAAARRADWAVEIVVVDDGSTDGTAEALRGLDGVVVVRQENQGRFAARLAGANKASGEFLLFVDSRVVVDETALVFLRDQLTEHPERRVWSGHVNVADDNPYAGFLSAMVRVPWRRYFAEPRLMSFDRTDFDLYPKGTGYLAVPKDLFEQGSTAFVSLYEDIRLASDDTKLLQWIAERERIWLSPDFSCTYNGRNDLKGFVKHAYFRGTTYVDGYLQTRGPARTGLFAVVAAGLAWIGLFTRKPKTAAAIAVTTSVAAGAAVRKAGATRSEAGAFARLLPLFGFGFLAGAIRGLALAARRRGAGNG
jgi:glycosyltransferase involved in cell wall biosynthesis